MIRRNDVGLLALVVAAHGCTAEAPAAVARPCVLVAPSGERAPAGLPSAGQGGFGLANGAARASSARLVAVAEGARLRLEWAGEHAELTTSVARDGKELLRGATGIDPLSRARRASGTAEELLEARGEALEAQWRFTSPPAGEGDLVVRVRLAGKARLEADGAHVQTSAHGEVIYGHGAWIEASARRTPVPVRLAGGALELRVPAAIVAESSYPATLDPLISVETPLDAPIATGAAVSGTHGAFTNGTYLASFVGADLVARAVRVLPTGTALDATPISLGSTPSYGRTLVSADGTRFAVVRAGSAGAIARFVLPDGTMPGSELVLPAALSNPLAIMYTGAFKVAGEDNGISLASFTSAGTVSASATVLDSKGRAPVALAGGSGLSVVGYQREGSSFTTSQLSTFSANMQVGLNSGATAAACFSGHCLVAFGTNGALVDSAATTFSTLTLPTPADAAVGETNRWLVSMKDPMLVTLRDRLIHVDNVGTFIETTPLIPTEPLGIPVATETSTYLFVDDRFARVVRKADLGILARVPFAPSTNVQTGVRLSAAPSGQVLATFSDDRPYAGTYAVRFGADGKAIDATPRVITPMRTPPSQYGTLTFGGGKHYLLTGHSRTSGTIVNELTQGVWEIATDGTSKLVAPVALALLFPASLAADDAGPVVFGYGGMMHRLGTNAAAFSLPTGCDSSYAPQMAPISSGILGVCRPPSSSADLSPQYFVIRPNNSLSAAAPVHATLTSLDYPGALATGPLGTFEMTFRRAGATSAQLSKWNGAGFSAPVAIANAGKLAVDADGVTLASSSGTAITLTRLSGPRLRESAPFTIPVASRSYDIASLGPRRALLAYESAASRIYTRVVTFGGDLGQPCGAASECESGLCADGVCCDQACDGQCEACDVPGLVGSCEPAKGPPHGKRAACGGPHAGTTCGSQCLGVDRTGCGLPPAGLACGADACTAGSVTHPSTCDGLGACGDTPVSCNGFACVGLVCGTSCTAKSDCVAGYYCKSNACVPLAGLGLACTSSADCVAPASCTDGVCCESATCGAGKTCDGEKRKGVCALANGQDCTAAAECGSDSCADGVCCDSACGEVCAACDLPGRRGTCSAVVGAPHGTRPSCATDATNVCASRRCDGTSTASCAAFATTDTICKRRSCTDGVVSDDARCDGAGQCAAATTSSCGGYACAVDACRTSCATKAECAAGAICTDGKCVPADSQCSDDGLFSVNARDGTRNACAPRVCDASTGKCFDFCSADDECVVGKICSSSGECVEPVAATEAAPGCGAAGRGAGRGGAWALLASLAVLGVRRARRGERPN